MQRHSDQYGTFYKKSLQETECYIVFLVDAKHLDYGDSQALVNSLKTQRSFGHAWFYMRGCLDGQIVEIEGGHSGELGRVDPKYFDGVMNYIESGIEPNPIKYLWTTLRDGFYQQGDGGHRPTFAAKVAISPAQFNQILMFIQPYNYCYTTYSLTHHQCTTFLVQIAALIGIILPCEVTIPIAQTISIGNVKYHLWTDSLYSELTIPSPDVLEQSLIKLVEQNNAEDITLTY